MWVNMRTGRYSILRRNKVLCLRYEIVWICFWELIVWLLTPFIGIKQVSIAKSSHETKSGWASYNKIGTLHFLVVVSCVITLLFIFLTNENKYCDLYHNNVIIVILLLLIYSRKRLLSVAFISIKHNLASYLEAEDRISKTISFDRLPYCSVC